LWVPLSSPPPLEGWGREADQGRGKRRDELRRLLTHRFPDPREREAAVMATYGAVWHRLLLNETLDAAFARDLAGLFMPTVPSSEGRQ